MPKQQKMNLNIDMRTWSPKLPSVPPPPVKRPKQRRAIVKPKPIAARPSKRFPKRGPNREYIESELKKIDFFLANRMLSEAKESYGLVLKSLHAAKGGKELKQDYKYDLRRIETHIELLEL